MGRKTVNDVLGGTYTSGRTGNEFLRYGRGGYLPQEWSQVLVSDQDMYSGVMYAAIEKRANRASALGKSFLFTDASPDLLQEARDSGIDLEHPYLKLIRSSKDFSRRKFWHDISTYLDLEGVYYLMAVRAIAKNEDGTVRRVGEVQEFKMLNPYNIKRVVNGAGELGGYVESRNGLYREIPKEMIIEIRLLNPFDNDLPHSMADAAKEAQFTMKTAGDYTRHAVRGNINSPGIITTDVVLDDPVFDNFISRLQNHTKGEPLYGNGAGAIKWESMQIDLDKASLDKINDIHTSTLFSVAGVNDTIMGRQKSGTGREVSKTQRDDFTENAVMPLVEDILDALNLDYRKYYKEWATNQYEIKLDNPLESDREAELKDIEIREKELSLRDTLIEQGYEYHLASKYAHGDITLEELGEPTLEREITDAEADAMIAIEMANRERGQDPDGNDEDTEWDDDDPDEPDDNPRTSNAVAINKMVPIGTNDKKLEEARKRWLKRYKKKKKTRGEQPAEDDQPVQEDDKKDKKPDEVGDKDENQVSASDFPDLYDGIDIDLSDLGCIMLDTESIPVIQFMPENTDDVFFGDETDTHYGVPGENEPHVTLLYGLLENGNIWKDKVNQLLAGWSCKTVTIERVSYFDIGDAYAVIGLLEKSPELIDGHERLTLLPHVQTHSEYLPHISLVYISKDADVNAWVKELNKRYRGQKVATKNINYGDPPEEKEPVPDSGFDDGKLYVASHVEDEHDMEKNIKDPCLCCGGKGEHKTGFECYRCDASGHEAWTSGGVPCDGREDSPNVWIDEDGLYRHAEEKNGVAKKKDPTENSALTYDGLCSDGSCPKHVNYTPHALKRLRKALNALEREKELELQAQLMQQVARLDGEIARKIIAVIETGDFETALEMIEAAQVEEEESALVLILATFFTALLPIYATQLLADRLRQFGVQAAFEFDSGLEALINEDAKKTAQSHVKTVAGDLYKAYAEALEEEIRRNLIAEIERLVQLQDESVLSKLPERPQHEDIVSAVDGGKFDSDPAYVTARELARQGQSREAIIRAIQAKYAHISQTRAATIARNESNRVFNISQFEADDQFLDSAGLKDRAYKRLVTNATDPCPICVYLINKTRDNPIPFNDAFVKIGDTIEGEVVNEDGSVTRRKMTFTWENVVGGVVHVNCRCRYQLVIKRDDGTFLSSLAAIVKNYAPEPIVS